ncbi:hypothetical protein L6452_29063 [Arctium lappa]|uniref:Uncharacterized protein n=1 Tax=Arctium lappa TaxID=4217 RepID=A0ACB8ZG78_ARCLA|nr:hypothetical protein L6452_29063 [Arctium lappa]
MNEMASVCVEFLAAAAFVATFLVLFHLFCIMLLMMFEGNRFLGCFSVKENCKYDKAALSDCQKQKPPSLLFMYMINANRTFETKRVVARE